MPPPTAGATPGTARHRGGERSVDGSPPLRLPHASPAGRALPPAREINAPVRERRGRLDVPGAAPPQLPTLVLRPAHLPGGTWMQTIAQNWLVYQLTGSARDLGLVNFVGAIPLVPLTLYAGAIADRFEKRKVIFWCQAAMMVLAFLLAALCWTGTVRFWHVLLLAFLLGAVQALDTPARQALRRGAGGGRRTCRTRSPSTPGVPRRARPRPRRRRGAHRRLGRRGRLLHQRGELPRRPLRPVPDGRGPDPPHRRRARIREGPPRRVRYLRKERLPRAVVVLISLSALFAMPYHVLIPIYAREIFGRGAAGTVFSCPRRGSARSSGRSTPPRTASGGARGRPSRRGA